MSSKLDVIVVGAGPAGSAAATRMAQAGLRVMLLDKREFPRDKTCGDALSPGAVGILHQLGLGRELRRRAHPVDHMVVTTPAGVRIQAVMQGRDSSPHRSHVWARYDLDEALRGRALRAGAEFEGRVRVRTIRSRPGEVEVLGEAQGRSIRHLARWAVLAVGANQGLLRSLGLLPQAQSRATAARAYFKGPTGIQGEIHFRFDGVPLPGYGWLFPLRDGTVNVGVGSFALRRSAARLPPGQAKPREASHTNAAGALDAFLSHPPVRRVLGSATQLGPVRSFPLRTDFHRSPLGMGPILLVGEAAGLVHPFTGEGIDYALESGLVAADSLLEWHAAPGREVGPLRSYVAQMRGRYQRQFVLASLMRSVYMQPTLLDALGHACNRWPELQALLVDILLSRQDPLRAFSPRFLLRVFRSIPQARASASPAKQPTG